jgi:hypothetical protein
MQRGELTRCANRDRMPRSKIHCLFDHLVGAGEHRNRRIEAERLPKLLYRQFLSLRCATPLFTF